MSQSSRCNPPARLSWPAGIRKGSATKGNKKPSSRKRPRFASVADNSSTDDSAAAMWVDRFTPTSSSDLCVAPKRVKEIKAWIVEAVARKNQKLLVLVGSPGIGKSTSIRVLASELDFSITTWNESYVTRNQESFRNDIVSIEQSSAMDSFQEFLRQCGTGFATLDLSRNGGGFSPTSYSKSIILLEELPNIHGPNAAQRFRDIMSQHLRRSQVPTVMIFSDVSEGKHRPQDLERLIDPTDLYSPFTCIRQIHPVTKPKMKQVLNRIAKVNCTGLKSVKPSNQRQNDRDIKLSSFHALGKLLYSKRTEKDGRSVLAFEPDDILERSDLGMGGSLQFLEYHSADFFTDIIELSNAFDLYSDATVLMDHPDRHRADSSFMHAYAASVAGRAVAHTNTKPTPNKFRQFSTPKVFEVLRKRRENDRQLEQLGRRLSNYHLSLSNSVGCTDTFITDVLPHMRSIVPNDSLYSIVGQGKLEKSATLKEIDKGLKEQAAILQVDDIVDYDSDSDFRERKPTAGVSNDGTNNESNKIATTLSEVSSNGPFHNDSSSNRKRKERRKRNVPLPSFDTATTGREPEIIVID
eukprot:scaffold7139_cov115-Cylindrotheca_fusiformis.AAC.8